MGNGNIPNAAINQRMESLICMRKATKAVLIRKQPQSAGYKLGMQRKDKKKMQYDLKDLQVKVKRREDDTKYVAKVLARGVDCDIALLSVESKEFWKEAKPLYLGHLPRLQEGEFMSMDFQMRHGKLIYLLSRCLLSFQNQP
ncbi:uncharacterized protein LOC107415100 isoform X1 [Ziziphus jujuba]|uniref:Uncharacterized protein LOC107415100 isoform X1 n=2 Tax=Ziziphus jujuba TaxID=326968 RepID=A0ABM3I6D0_ZIZJJ|nr:uncharacterized protein LOC107415100 isoform X1 [Ziziphus jujuba]XP_048321499.2 uncharacterized protein LOC107415100 isoform X1 [Ziziphus jujuba]